MILARDVLDKSGRVLIANGNMLRPEIVGLLAKHAVTAVWVEDCNDQPCIAENHELAVVDDIVSAEMRLQMIDSLQQTFDYSGGLARQLPVLQASVLRIVNELGERQDILLYLNDIRVNSDYLYKHCVDVSIFAVGIGLSLGLPLPDVCLLGMGGLLHDFGKTKISPTILNKRGPLTVDEFKQIKDHTVIGYHLLQNGAELDQRVPLMALQHHERGTGLGYPWGVTASDIHPLARIVAVADVYDALTTNRAYRPPLPTWTAIRIIAEDSDGEFDREVVQALQRVVAVYNIGCQVRLSNGVTGKVTKLNSADLSRPIVMTDCGPINLFYETKIDIIAAI